MPSLLEALERKYFSDDDPFQFDDVGRETTTAAAVAGGINTHISVFIPAVSPLLCVPELLVLNDCDIDHAGDFETNALADKCQRVRELDLAQNKLHDWQEVFHILQYMPRIRFLNLSKNQLMGPITQFGAPSIGNLRGIVLNGTYLDWPCIDVLLANLPLLEELHLSLNNYKEVRIDSAPETVASEDGSAASAPTHNDADADADVDAEAEAEADAANENENENCCCTTSPANTEPCSPNTPNHNCQTGGGCTRSTPHKALKTLHFTGNPIESWMEICRLGRVFPCLENLVLADCPIKSIDVNTSSSGGRSSPAAASTASADSANADSAAAADNGDDDDTPQNTASATSAPHEHFLNLLVLNLSCANINTWDDIDQLAQFPKLKNLRVKNWPLWERLECTEHERRQLLIARLPNVSLLNGGVITADEREDAERAFIRHYMNKPEWERPKRYDELIMKHGKLDPLVNINLKPDKRVKVLLTYKETTASRLVDIYCTVSDLKVRLEKIVGLPANKMRLYYLDQDYREFGPEEMRYPNKFLYSYNIQPGDEIIVDEKK